MVAVGWMTRKSGRANRANAAHCLPQTKPLKWCSGTVALLPRHAFMSRVGFEKNLLKASTPGNTADENVAHCEIDILAGGASSRMRRNKASLRLGKRTLLGHIRATARNSGLPHRVIRRDLVPRCGPLGGVYTALSTSRAETILFLSCDTPFISAHLLKALVRRLSRPKKALFVKVNGRLGFPFLLRREALPVVKRQLAAGQFSLHKLARALRAQTVRLPRCRAHELLNINTPEDWRLARERWRGLTGGSSAPVRPKPCLSHSRHACMVCLC